VLRILFEDVGAGDVGRQEIGGELHAPERELHRLGEGRDQERLGEAGNPDEQGVAAREQRHQHGVDDLVLTHHAHRDGLAQRLGRRRRALEEGDVVFGEVLGSLTRLR